MPTPNTNSRKASYLDAIIDQLMSTGINDLSLRELAAQVGTSHRVLIYHFTSKENLVNEVVQEVRRRERELFRESGAPLSNALRDRLIAFFDHNISQGMRSYFRLFYEVWGIALSKPELYQPFLEGIVSVWVESLSEILQSAGFDPERATARATLVLAALRGAQLDLFTTGDESRVRDGYLALVDMLQREAAALAPDSPARTGVPHETHHD